MSDRRKPEWVKIGRELRALRKKAKMTQADLAPYASVVPAQVSAWENGRRGMSQEQAVRLDEALNANSRLLHTWERTQNTETIPPWHKEVSDIEQKVTELREYQCQVIPGLIQTADYARATFRDGVPWASAADIEVMVESRLKRQKILDKEHPPLVSMVVESHVLSRIVGDESIQITQLDHVLALIEEGKIRLQVTSPNARHHPGNSGPLRIYTFPDDPTLASAEHSGGEALMTDQDTVQKRMTIFGFLQAEALSTGASMELIREVRKSIDEHSRPQ